VAGLVPDGGEVRFERAGATLDPGEVQARSLHLLAPGEGIAARLTVRETLAFWARLLGGAGEGVAGRVGLEASLDRPAGALSTGQRRRLGLARLLLAPRALWLLDEPLSGLDEAGRALLLAEIAEHRTAGGMVLMATHEAEGLPDAPTLRLG
jgi:heme exporter protein A